MSRSKRSRNVCRKICIISFAIAYVCAYTSLSRISDYTIPLEDVSYDDRQNKSLHETHLSEIKWEASSIAREYKRSYPSTWCVDSRLKLDQRKGEPMGLSYLKIPHAAGGTLKGINMRISRNFAQRHNIETCIRHDSDFKGMQYGRRDQLSYLWTFVRDPTTRAMSVIGSTLSSQLLGSNSRESFNRTQLQNEVIVTRTLDMLQHSTHIRTGILSEGRGGFQLQFGMQYFIPVDDAFNPHNPGEIVDHSRLIHHVKRVFRSYNFVGLVERFDESLVVMQLLLGLESSDILYFAVNRKDEWKRAKVGSKQYACRKSFDWEIDLITEPSIRDYLMKSEEWHARNYGDYLLYQAAAQSLDQTILMIGLDVFSRELKKFRSLMKRANEECSPIFPCSSNGADQFKEAQFDCMADGRIGCGYSCLNGLTG